MADDLQSYAGRWVARVRGQVVGVGLTAEAARAAAQLSRPKETPQVLFVPDNPPIVLPEVVNAIRQALPAQARLWVVGGAIRDALLNRRIRDLDFAVEGEALRMARAVANKLAGAYYPLDADRDVGRVLLQTDDGDVTLDFARLRGPDLETDLAARDFTINALAVALNDPETLIDPLGGLADVRAKRIRVCSPSAIADDPLRGVRAVRLAAQLDFRLEKETRSLIRAQTPALRRVSAERVRDEVVRCVNGPRPGAALRALDRLGLLDQIIPELTPLKEVTQSPPHVLDVWEHTLAVVTRLDEILNLLGPVHDVDAASDLILGLISVQLGRYRHSLSEHLRAALTPERNVRAALMLAALLHDSGKPATRTVDPRGRIRFLTHEAVGADLAEARLTELRLSGDELKRIRTIIANHMRPRQLSSQKEVSSRAIYRFFRDTGAAGVDIVLLSLADFLGKHGGEPPPQDEWAHHLVVCAQLLEAYFEKHAERVAPPALLTGHDVMTELGWPPGPHLGQVL
jgi:tRNA nucleotidyltransferase/poly(A) polymerase